MNHKRLCYNFPMPTFRVDTAARCYSAIVERGLLAHAMRYVPAKAGKVFVVTTADVWRHQGVALAAGLAGVDL